MWFLRFSIARIRPKIKKFCQISIYINSSSFSQKRRRKCFEKYGFHIKIATKFGLILLCSTYLLFFSFFFFLGSTYLQFVYNIILPKQKHSEYSQSPVTNVKQLGRTGDHREREKASETTDRERDSCLLPLGNQHRSPRVWRIDRRPQKERNPWAHTATNSAGEVFTRGCKQSKNQTPRVHQHSVGSSAQRSTHRKRDRHASLPLRSARIGSETVIPHFR